jgi:primosomal protein N' (replication factor Y)
MFAEIIPINRLPLRIKTFSYLIPSELENEIKVGQAVEIPFRNKNITGIVLELKKESDLKIKLKAIIRIIDSTPFMNDKQLKLAFWMADYYHLSLGLILKAILPQIPKRKGKEKEIVKNEIRPIDLSENLKSIADAIFTVNNPLAPFDKGEQNIPPPPLIRGNLQRYYLWYTKDEDKKQIYLELAKRLSLSGKQILLITPEINNLNDLTALFKKYFSNDLVAILHGDLSNGEYFSEWEKIRNNQAKIILGTRIAIFAPVDNLGLIILDREHDSSHKQWDQNPRYHDREIAEKLVELTNVKLLLSDSAPSLESYYKIKNNDYELLELRDADIIKPKIIDMREEVRGRNYSPISESLKEAIEKTLEEKKQIFLFINRRGTSTSAICEDCGYVFKCPDCKLPLTYHGDKYLKCHNCNFKQGVPLFCPSCRGPEIKFLGTGTQKIENEIRKIDSNIKIARIDIDTQKKNQAEQKYCSVDCDVIIGTQLALKSLDWTRIGLVGIVSADTILYLPDFRSSERTYQLFSDIIYKASEYSPAAKIIIQTRKPENYALMALLKSDPGIFYDEELKDREDFHYPPYSQLIKLIFQHPNEKKVIYESRRLWMGLNKKIESLKGIEISQPQPIYSVKVRGRYRYQIIVKIRDKRYQILDTIPDNWIIDINPDSLL